MNIKAKTYKLLQMSLILLGLVTLTVSCDDDEFITNSQNGYVQFKLYKSASYNKKTTSRAANNQLDYLSDAQKIKIILNNQDNLQFSQTLDLNAYNDENSEYGMRSDKLELTPGEYTVKGFYLYDKPENQIYVGQPAETTKFIISSGGMVVQDLLVDATPRGTVNFRLVKNIIKRAAADSDAYPFSSINKVDITVLNTDTKKRQTIEDLEVTYTEELDSIKLGYRTSYGKTDSLVIMEAGTYKILSYTAYDKTTILQYYNDEVLKNAEFTVEDNKQTNADVPVTLLETAANIKDYICLKKIWEAMQGEKWSYNGQSYPKGSNWNFEDKDIDMWGEQPGVVLDTKGRVTSLSLGEFGAIGKVPAEIGELTELQTLALGTHNDLLTYENTDKHEDPLTSLKGQLTPARLTELRNDYMDNYARHDLREDLSEPLQLALKIKENYQPTKQRKGIQPKDVAWGELTNQITGISAAIGKLKKLEVLYIANSPITELPAASDEGPGMAGLDACTDLEIYNCPNLKKFPTVIADMKELIQVNLAMNKQIKGDDFTAGLKALAEGPSKEKIQILYLGYNNLEELPAEIRNMKKLGKIDLISNKLKKLPAFGKNINLVQGTFDYNQISEIETVDNGEGKQIFCGMEDVESLSFSHNQLEYLPDIFDVTSPYIIASVDFSYNKIKDEGLKGFSGINSTEISLAGNQLKSFPGVLINTGSPLTVLNLSANQISTFNNSDLKGKYAYMLTTLDLTYNRLSKLPSDFDGKTLPYLYGLDLSGNRLDAFPWGTLNISYLTVLSLRNQRDENGNRVYKEWPTGVSKHTGLRALFLGGNNLGKIPETETISYLIYVLDISDNPNIIINVSDVCPYIKAGMYNLIYDPTQDIRGCDALDLE